MYNPQILGAQRRFYASVSLMMFRALVFSLLAGLAAAETGLDAWLRYAPLPRQYRSRFSMPSAIVALNSSETSPVYTAGQELAKGYQGIFGKHVGVCHSHRNGQTIVVGTLDQYTKAYGALSGGSPELEMDGFWLSNQGSNVQILGQNERGALYGAFEYLSMLAQGNATKVAYATSPKNQIRWTNEWDSK